METSSKPNFGAINGSSGARLVVAALAIGLSTLTSAPHAQAQSDVWRITAAQAECLISNKNGYLNLGGEVIIIPVTACPDTSLYSGSLDDMQNYGGISNIESKSDEDGLDAIITFTAKDLECLDNDDIIVSGEVAQVPRSIDCGE
jgi:hypothetical protein